MIDTVLVVDDEDSVRRTFSEWLAGANLNIRVLAAADAEGYKGEYHVKASVDRALQAPEML